MEVMNSQSMVWITGAEQKGQWATHTSEEIYTNGVRKGKTQ